MLDHVVASGISKHFTEQNVLFDLQYGFWEKRSYQTQLIMLINKLAKHATPKINRPYPTDFSEAIDKVPLEKLLLKLHFIE